MTSHLLILIVFAALVSLAFALLMRDEIKARCLFGLKIFALFLAAVVLIGWLMYPFPN
ncbi:MAG: hypothetical protein MUF51_10930 [Vicinamibacteria bacterium]|jgi:hypothetical protein|nr:hypothetical protein [Vicinamibacteria bacterium]